jgi:hypothetical protein
MPRCFGYWSYRYVILTRCSSLFNANQRARPLVAGFSCAATQAPAYSIRSALAPSGGCAVYSVVAKTVLCLSTTWLRVALLHSPASASTALPGFFMRGRMGGMSDDLRPRFSVRRLLIAMLWFAVCLTAWATIQRLEKSNMPGKVVDRYMPLLWFGLFTPPFAAIGALCGRHRLGLVIGVVVSAIGFLTVLLLNYSGVGS